MGKIENSEELLKFADSAERQGQRGTVWVQQANYTAEETILSDEDVAGRESLQKLRILIEASEDSNYAEFLFSTAAELEELMSDLQPVFDWFTKEVVTEEKMDEKVHVFAKQ